VKSMHPGWAAHAGLLAARLAAVGLSGPETALEGGMGLFQQFADAGAVAVERFSASLRRTLLGGAGGGANHLRTIASEAGTCERARGTLEPADRRGRAPDRWCDRPRDLCRAAVRASPRSCPPRNLVGVAGIGISTAF